MPFSSQDLLLGILLPTVIALFGTSAAVALSRRRDLTRIGGSLAVVVGYLAGYWLLNLGPVLPKLDRDWLPYCAVVALTPVLVPRKSRHRLRRQLLALAIVIVIAAWLLVPARESLEPSRTVHLIVWSGYTFLLSAGMLVISRAEESPGSATSVANMDRAEAHAPRSAGFVWLLLIVAALLAASGVLLLGHSLRYCQITAVGTASIAGFAVAYWFFRIRSSLEGVSLVYSFLISAVMLTGKVNSFSDIPTASYLLLPLTPLAYGLAVPERSGKLAGKRILLVVAVAIGVCGLAVGLALAAELGGESQY